MRPAVLRLLSCGTAFSRPYRGASDSGSCVQVPGGDRCPHAPWARKLGSCARREGSARSAACAPGGVALSAQAKKGTIRFWDETGYLPGANCSWTVSCLEGNTPYLKFTEMSTERDFDFVDVFDGGNAASMEHLSGLHSCSESGCSGIPRELRATGATMAVRFTSDATFQQEGGSGGGFEAQYGCKDVGVGCTVRVCCDRQPALP